MSFREKTWSRLEKIPRDGTELMSILHGILRLASNFLETTHVFSLVMRENPWDKWRNVSRRDETGYFLSLLVNYVSLWDYIQVLAGLFHTPSSTGWTSLSSVARPPSWVRGMYCRPGTCSWHAVVWFGFGPWRLRGPRPKAWWVYFGDLK